MSQIVSDFPSPPELLKNASRSARLYYEDKFRGYIKHNCNLWKELTPKEPIIFTAQDEDSLQFLNSFVSGSLHIEGELNYRFDVIKVETIRKRYALYLSWYRNFSAW